MSLSKIFITLEYTRERGNCKQGDEWICLSQEQDDVGAHDVHNAPSVAKKQNNV